jgi:glutaredoxin
MNLEQNYICPLCGGQNECALAKTGSLDGQCWCREVKINPAAIARAHEQLHNQSCICMQCAMATTSNPELPQVKIKLYSTRFCHLCKEAETIIRKAGIFAIYIDISEDDDLLEKYSERIPVLRRVDNDAELGWPFDAETVLRFLM